MMYLDCKQLYIDISHYCQAVALSQLSSLSGHDFDVRTVYLHAKFKYTAIQEVCEYKLYVALFLLNRKVYIS